MKKILIVLLLLGLSVSVAYAETDMRAERALNRMLKSWRSGDVTLRSAVVSNDLTTPTIASGYNVKGYPKVLLKTTVANDASWTLTPLFGDATTYYEGTSRTVSGDEIFVLDTYGCIDFYVKLDGQSSPNGWIPTITVKMIVLQD